jgi:hypothetical protein
MPHRTPRKMELQLLEEERQREKEFLQSAAEKTSGNYVQVVSERDAAKAKARDLEQQLAAAHADVELANTDRNRALMANENLQRALEDFQSERDAEIALLMEQRTADEEAIEAAHNASLEAMREANAAEIRDIQYAANKSVQNSLVEIDKMEATIQVSCMIIEAAVLLCCHVLTLTYCISPQHRNAERTI